MPALPANVAARTPVSITDTLLRLVGLQRISRPFPAGEPMPATEPGGSPPRAHVVPPYANTVTTPRRYGGVELTPFALLRQFAKFDMVSIAMEDCIGQIEGMEWDLEPVPGAEKATGLAAERDRIRERIEQIDPLAGIDITTFLGMAAREIYTTDALTLYPRYTRGGEPIGLEQVDGATIVPLVDDRGRPPLPPEVAYQQTVHGRIETEFWAPVGPARNGQLWYLPRRPRIDCPYGYSCVEQVLWTVNLAMRKMQDDLSYWSQGKPPDMLVFVEGMTPLQLAELQGAFDTLAAMDSATPKSPIRFVPGGSKGSGGATSAVEMRSREFKVEMIELLARTICYAFSVSPLPLVSMMNRATAEQAEMAGIEGGVRPVARFIARVLNRYIRHVLGSRMVRFAWAEDETADEALVIAREESLSRAGCLTIDDRRVRNGLEPYGKPWSAVPYLVTGAGVKWLTDDFDPADEPEPAPFSPFAARGALTDDEGDADTEQDEEPEDDPASKGLVTYAQHARAELAKLKRIVDKRRREGRPLKKLHSRVLTRATIDRLNRELGAA